MKTIKIMSDGNQAKVGMIIYDKSVDSIGIITHTKTQPISLNKKSNGTWNTYIWQWAILYKPIVNIHKCPLTDETGFLISLVDDISKATPEQKKLYWLELEKQTIQFRPEFEAKLKELGIRDQFVNNLFDPKFKVHDPKERRQKCLNAKTWHEFIRYAFVWTDSPEKYEYWSNISHK